ncbi:uncharacterized protein MGC147242.L [Xenopus laevis]|uniref:MGC115285 protein n=2 Tax=Xenopus laevis TaxID=8355 RepID=Q52KW6_XENLA|nr:uncharacterized protein MGC147242.L [Xenopus laevis]XP_018090063.1 uncharacterized protein MGC147242.L [Xenopus laevis]XP_041433316.1 uncharacterized protein MGC147242.L [Xenopus laevis]AAH94161.1 MGC115285 protein [Xenopus laevis]OCT63318.1 hypothetical protein XELAEV_18044416mg [Xenopus laevis]
MDALERILTEDEENLLSYSVTELESFVQLLSAKVKADKETVEQMKAELLGLEAETLERGAERDLYASMLAQAAEVSDALTEEAQMHKQLRSVSQELKNQRTDSDVNASVRVSSDFRSDRHQQRPDVDREFAIASYHKKEKVLLEKRDQLQNQLQNTQAALAKAQLQQQKLDEELLELQQDPRDLVASKSPEQSDADHLLDECIKEMGLLRVLPDTKPKRK